MDVVDTSPADSFDVDPKQQLSDDVERVRAEREDLDRQIAADREKLGPIRTALDAMVNASWRDVYGQQQRMRERDNITEALTLGWTGSCQLIIAGLFVLVAAGAIYALQGSGLVLMLGTYIVLALAGYFVARDQCLAPIKKARASYLGSDGKDVRFVAFTRYEPGLNHPLVGYDGPTNGILEDRAWKIPGVREKEALEETFVEVIDERRSNVLLTRFPDKKPTLVHADLENPFIRSYGVFFQRALEHHLPQVATQADDFHEIVAHQGARKEVDERVRRMEEELREYDGTAAIIKSLALPATTRNELIRQVILYRLDDPKTRRGLFIIGNDRVDMMELMQALSRAAAATLLHLSFSQIKIGYVGQGASSVSRIFATAKRARAIIFIDEAERFFTSGSAAYEAMRKEALQALWSEWDELEGRPGVWVVACANTREGLDESAIARFGAVIDLAPGSFGEVTAETMVIDPNATQAADQASMADVELPEPVLKRSRMLAAMFAHVATMESQGITVPRAVLIAGPNPHARQLAIKNIADQTGLPVIPAFIDDLDQALATARTSGHAIVAVDVPEYGDPGSIAHLAVTIDQLSLAKEPIFIVAETFDANTLDPELRSRFPEFVDLTELGADARRARIQEWLGDKPVGFDLAAAMDGLLAQSEGMTEEQLRHFVDEAGRSAALRAIDAGAPDHVIVELVDFERRTVGPESATKDDEAAL
ncbi:MAG TPA: AAA family ATPase [Candidatus Acidoferrales bacterium]|nr:AAA family ATPase [Candidatus Acidoferrales bacterium]